LSESVQEQGAEEVCGTKREEVRVTGGNGNMRSFVCTPHQYHLGDSIREDDVGTACGTYGGEDKCI